MLINKQIEMMIKELTGNNIPATKCRITKTYQESTLCDIKTEHGTFKMVDASQEALVGDTGLLVFLDGDMGKPYVLVNGQGSGGGVIMVGSFEINEDGDLIVTLPTGTVNPYHINESGDLIYSTDV